MCDFFNCKFTTTLQLAFSSFFKPGCDAIFEEMDQKEDLVILKPEVVFSKLRMRWRQLEDVIICDKAELKFSFDYNEIINTVYNIYATLFQMTPYIKDYMTTTISKHLKLLRSSILRLSELDESEIKKLTSSILEVESPTWQYFHTYLITQVYLLKIELLVNYNWDNVKHELLCLMKDLVTIGKVQFKTDTDKQQINPFICDCTKYSWAFVQTYTRNVIGNENLFWDMFKSSITEMELSLWLLNHISALQLNFKVQLGSHGDVWLSPNHEFVEDKIQQLCSLNVPERTMFNCLIFINPVVNNLWGATAKINIYKLLWVHFNKNIGNGSEDVNFRKSTSAFFELMDHLHKNPYLAKDSFEFFTAMLTKHLKKHPDHWPKLKASIFSRLTVQAVSKLSDKGLWQIFLLLASLIFLDFEEMARKMRDILENLPLNRQRSEAVWSLHVALIQLHILNNNSIEPTSKNLVSQLQEVSNHRDLYYLIKWYITDLESLVKASNNYNLQQHILIGGWVKKYMLHCPHNDLDELLRLLIYVSETAAKTDTWSYWEYNFQTFVFPVLKQTATNIDSSPLIGKLAAIFAKISPEFATQTITYFGGDLVSPKISAQFVTTLLHDYPSSGLIPNQENFMVRAWVRCCLLTTTPNEELMKNMLKLHGSFALVKNRLDMNENVLCSYIEAISTEYSAGNNMLELKSLFETSFSNCDLWIKPYVKEPTNEALVMHICTCMAVLVFYCAPLLYSKTKSVCLLSRLTSVLLTPTEVLVGRVPHKFLLNALQKTWHLFVKGIASLDWTEDVFLERILKDLIVCYVPYLALNESPIIKCFIDENLSNFMLQKISSTFLLQNARNTKENAIKVLRFINHCVEIITDVSVFQTLVEKLFYGVLEYLLFNLQCNAAVCTVTSISCSDFYNFVRENVKHDILKITEKHLGFTANNYFQLAQILARVMPEDVRELMPRIEENVAKVEKMRGVGYDTMLRRRYDGLMDVLKQNAT